MTDQKPLTVSKLIEHLQKRCHPDSLVFVPVTADTKEYPVEVASSGADDSGTVWLVNHELYNPKPLPSAEETEKEAYARGSKFTSTTGVVLKQKRIIRD